MNRKTYLKKRVALLTKVMRYAKEHNTSTPAEIKRANKNLWSDTTPDFNRYHCYKEAYEDLKQALSMF